MAASQQLAALLRESEVAVIEGGGAVLNAEAPRELADLATRFLDADDVSGGDADGGAGEGNASGDQV